MTHEFMVSHTDVRTWWEPAELQFTARGPRWLRSFIDRAMRAALRWSCAEIKRNEKIRTFRRAEGETLLERMRLSVRDMEMLYDRRARYVFIGPDVEPELLNIWHVMSLGLLDARLSGPRGIKEIMGVEVVFVPWMKGTLLVPELPQSHTPARTETPEEKRG